MAGVHLPDMRPWGRRALTIPPASPDAWLRLAIWEMWMGTLVCVIAGLGLLLVSTAPDRIVAVSDLSGCYAAPPVQLPCEKLVYQGGVLNMLFTGLFGVMLIGVALWFLWELWSAVEPKPLTDDFLKLLNASFGRSWRNPLRWPWGRLLWAYGFAGIGALLTAAIVVAVANLPSPPETPPTIHIDTSETFRLGQ